MTKIVNIGDKTFYFKSKPHHGKGRKCGNKNKVVPP